MLAAPKEFSFVSNTENLISYFDRAKKQIEKSNDVHFDLSEINKLTPDAIALLVARVADRRFRGPRTLSGSAPTDEKLRDMFAESGFYDHVRSQMPKRPHPQKLLLHRVSNNRVEPDLAKKACEVAVTNTFRRNEKFQPLYEILIECMSNTNNDAGLDRQGSRNWWLYVYYDSESGISHFAFLDLGVGVFGSLPVQTFRRSTLFGTRQIPNKDLFPKLLSGEISSRTERKERGRGFPQIYLHAQNQQIKNFVIISNDAYAHLPERNYKELKKELNGTFFYWELHPRVVG